MGEEKFDRMAIDGDNTNGRRPFMVHFVETFVESRMMKNSMRVIEEELLDENADAELDERPVEVCELTRSRVSPPNEHGIDCDQDEGSNHELVE